MSPPHESLGPGGEETRRCPPHPACSSRQPSNGTPHADATFTSASPPPRLQAPAHLAHLGDTPPGHLPMPRGAIYRVSCHHCEHDNTPNHTGRNTIWHTHAHRSRPQRRICTQGKRSEPRNHTARQSTRPGGEKTRRCPPSPASSSCLPQGTIYDAARERQSSKA